MLIGRYSLARAGCKETKNYTEIEIISWDNYDSIVPHGRYLGSWYWVIKIKILKMDETILGKINFHEKLSIPFMFY